MTGPLLDLTACDAEPIHLPGTIQPHGVLLAFDERDLKLALVSANAGEALGTPLGSLLGSTVERVLGSNGAKRIASALGAKDLVLENPLRLNVGTSSFDAAIHQNGDLVILELEAVRPDFQSLDRLLREAITHLQRAQTTEVLCNEVAEQVRVLTGFDRVMVYRFHADGHGEVVAEARSSAMDPFLGHHFPASDIPRQARELYMLNPIRTIPDARYAPVPLLGAAGIAPQALDLTFAALRSVSPVHLEYLANMGVGASMSVSLIREHRLWALLACHHATPRHVPSVVRSACEVVSKLVSLQIGALEERATRTQRETLRGGESVLVDAMRSASDGWASALMGRSEALLRVVDATGAAVIDENGIRTTGEVPTKSEIAALVAWLPVAGRAAFATNALSSEYAEAVGWRSVASGLLAVRIPKPRNAWLLWFRREVLQTLTWGGDPSKPVSPPVAGERLHPRQSFAAWREIVRGSSAPWTSAELEVAEDLARRAVESDLEHQIVRAESAVQTRDDLVAVVSHDLKNPVNVIQMAATSGRRHLTDPVAVDLALQRIERAAQRMTGLITDLLDLGKIEAGRFHVQPDVCDLDGLVGDIFAFHSAAAEQRGVRLESELASVDLFADRDRLFQVLSNLVGNALKFTPSGGVVKVSTRLLDRLVRIDVEDTGPGIPPNLMSHVFDRYWQAPGTPPRQGSGLGLYIAKGLVESHGGRIWVSSTTNAGTTFSFTLPLGTPPAGAP